MIRKLILYLENLASIVPLEIFSFFGSIIEEIFAPIPSPMVMTLAGSLASAQNKGFLFLFYLSVFASIGKTIMSYVYYVIGDKAEDILLSKFGKFIGITHKEVESLGKYFNGSIRDDLIILFFRVLPIIPTAIVSVVCGTIKINKFTYIRATFIGFIFRSLIFLYIGFAGISTYKELSHGSSFVDVIKYLAIITFLISPFVYIYFKKYKGNIKIFFKNFLKKS